MTAHENSFRPDSPISVWQSRVEHGGAASPSSDSSISPLIAVSRSVKRTSKAHGRALGTEHGPAANSMNAGVLAQRLAVIQKYLDTRLSIIEGPLLVPGRDDLRTSA